MTFSAVVDTPVNRADPAQVDAMNDPISFVSNSADKVQGLIVEANTALARLHRLVLPKVPQVKTLHELSDTFLVKEKTAVEVLKAKSRIFGAYIALQVMMGNGVDLDYEEVVKRLPQDQEGNEVDLSLFENRAKACAISLVEFANANKRGIAAEETRAK